MERKVFSNGYIVRVKYSELSRSLEQQLIDKVLTLPDFAEAKVPDDRELATQIRDYLNAEPAFSGAEGTEWHVIVGEHFVCSFKHENRSIIFFDVTELRKSILAFKSG
eukprot:TRINITY_DN16531_c0_g1_i3.p2 TRINITY_DN16531_c0_g1~~TRINITY_DN16531_c0_g1_i3.p2  ORF type:complete len:108 (+),score=28.29 TRINITY_DN16531_c0_g1_i3:125-448(+)